MSPDKLFFKLQSPKLIWGGIICLFLLLSCEDELLCPVTVSLVISPGELILQDNAPTGNVYLSTQPDGELNWQVAAKPDWVELTPNAGKIDGKIQEITVKANTENFDVGVYNGKVALITDVGGAGEFEIILNVKVHPEAKVSPDTLKFPESIETASFMLSNQGTGYLTWSIKYSETWLSAYPRSGALGSGESFPITAVVKRTNLVAGRYSTKIMIESNSETGVLELPVTMTVGESPRLAVSANALTFNYQVDTLRFSVYNTGNTAFNWNAQVNETYIQLDPLSGTVAPGDSNQVMVVVIRDDLTSGTHTAGITITNHVNQTENVQITIQHFEETKWMLNHRVVDSEYDRINDVIVTVAAEPARLFVLDPESQTFQSIDLPLTPNCVAIRPDGQYAVVGFDGYFSYVNLASLSIEKTYAITIDALDIILPSNGWVYAFPKQDQWANISCVQLSTGTETNHTGSSIYAGTVAKLHPSGEFIYGADNGLSPSDFEKYDIRNGTAVYLYDSPYHGDYSFSGDLWISDDGKRIFARSGNVFRASTVRAEDMVYNGKLAGMTSVKWVDYSTAAHRIYAVGGSSYWEPGEPEIRIYETNYLAFQGTIDLPGFLVPGENNEARFYESEGQFVFVNSAGTKVYALIQAEESAGLLQDWAVVAFDVSSL